MKLTVSLVGAAVVVLLSSTAFVLTPREPECRFAHDAPAGPTGGPSLERAHVVRDLAEIEREARRFGAAVARRPLASDSIDAREGARTAPMRAVAWCRATLLSELANIHGTSANALLAAGTGDAAQAGADRTIRVDATSSGVSRPSR